MPDSETLRANERYKAIAGGLGTFGSALIGAGVVKVYTDKGIGWEVAGWFFTAALLIWLAYRTLGLLESET